MGLLEWKAKYGRSQLDYLAELIGTKGSYLSQVAHGHRKISPRLAMEIEKATFGEVTRSDLRPDVYLPGKVQPDQQG